MSAASFGPYTVDPAELAAHSNPVTDLYAIQRRRERRYQRAVALLAFLRESRQRLAADHGPHGWTEHDATDETLGQAEEALDTAVDTLAAWVVAQDRRAEAEQDEDGVWRSDREEHGTLCHAISGCVRRRA